MWGAQRRLLLTALLFAVPVQSDKGSGPERENYERALESEMMYNLDCRVETLSEFVGPHRVEASVIVLLHDAHTPNSRRALPEFEAVANDLADLHVAFGHADCGKNKEWMRTSLGIRTLPSVLFWRNSSFDNRELLGQDFVVTTDKDFLVRAIRNAGASMWQRKSPILPSPKERMTMLGDTVKVVTVDPRDITVEVNTSDGMIIRMPEEVLMTKDRKALPYRRDEAMLKYHAKLERHHFEEFVMRLLQPLIVEIDGREHLEKEMGKELGPALVLCAPELHAAFVELASLHQNSSRAFHAKTEAGCPVPRQPDDSKDRIVVFSTHWQQWAANGKPKAAACVTSGELLDDEPALDEWVSRNHFPGIMKLCPRTFRDRLRGTRGSVVVAIRMSDKPKDQEDANFVEKKLHEIAKPRPISEDVDLYDFGAEFGIDGYYVAVANASMNGLAHYGVDTKKKTNVPKVIVFDSIDWWVEDRALTIDKFPQALTTIHEHWRFRDTLRGTFIWLGRKWRYRFEDLDSLAEEQAGPAGRPIWVAVLILIPLTIAFGIKKCCCESPHDHMD